MKFARSAGWPSLQRRLFSILLCGVITCSTPVLADEDWIGVGADGDLVYRQVHEGDRIPDFSAAGYGEAGEPLPHVATVGEVSRQGDALAADSGDADRIQAAIDAAGALPLNAEGFRGAIELAPGDYQINKTIIVAYSGIVLRGASGGAGRTRLVAGAANGPMIVIAGEGKPRASEPPRKIMDAYVAVGARTLTVSDTTGLSVGDHVMVQRPFTQGWISLVGMDQLPPRQDGRPVKQWGPGPGIVSDRRVIAISGSKVTLDAPLTDAIAASDGGTLWRYSFPGRISKIGLENITADGTSYQPSRLAGEIVRMPRDGATFLIIDSAADVWVRDVELTNFVQPVQVRSRARDISIVGFLSRSSVQPWWRAPPSAISVDGQKVLVKDCLVTGSRIQAFSVQSFAPGPNVFSKCRAEGIDIVAGPHQRWANGILFDDVHMSGALVVKNRGNMGTGQGWSGANVVIWNSTAQEGIWLQSPPGAYIWAVGASGPILESSGAGTVVEPDDGASLPPSLFDAQVSAASATTPQ